MTRTRLMLLAVAALSWNWSMSPALAQRGMGDSTGIAQRQALPEIVTFSGKLTAVETQPCKGGTGSGIIGTHIVLKAEKNQVLNIDLGWAKAVEPIVKQLKVGQELEVSAFQTDKMPNGRYVAKSLTFGGKTVQLRDANLRPFWAGRGSSWYDAENEPIDRIRQGTEPRYGWGRGYDGPGSGYGWGRGYGRGRGYGWGRGYGRGRGRGWGRGYPW